MAEESQKSHRVRRLRMAGASTAALPVTRFDAIAAVSTGDVPLLRALLEISRAVLGAQYLEEALEAIAEQARYALGAASVSISRWERDVHVLRTLINVGELGPGERRWPDDELYSISDDEQVTALLTHGRPYVNTVDDDQAPAHALAILRRLGKDSEVAVAVMVDDTIWGELWATGTGGRRFSREDVQLLQAIAAHVAVAIGRTEVVSTVWRYAFEDSLTGLPNRRRLDEWIEDLDGDDTRPVVLLCDIDGFKLLNDRDGHLAGDAVLRGVAATLARVATATPDSLTARLGGDEFCVVLPNSTLADAERFAHQANAAVRREVGRDVSLCWGAALFGPLVASGEALIAAADAALLEAKRLGPGRFSIGIAGSGGLPGVPHRRAASGGPTDSADDLVSRTVRLLDDRRPDTVAGALEIVGVQVCSAVGAAAWSISATTPDGAGVQTLRGVDSLRDGVSGLRVLSRADPAVYPLDRYPATAHALDCGQTFLAATDVVVSDPAEVALLHDLGYRAVLGVGVDGGDRRYLLELYSDRGHAELAVVAPHVRVLAHYAAATRRRS